MDKVHKHIIGSSIRDTVRILDSAPVKPDMIPEITAYQMMNRAPIAHLSIERGLKSLIIEFGGQHKDEHNLLPLYRKLGKLHPEAATFFSKSFDEAVRTYRYNVNTTGSEHLKSLKDYLSKVGSEKAFTAMRYWEFEQSLDEEVLRRISLPIHRELLHALWQLFMSSNHRMTVTDRIERTVRDAIFDPPKLAYSPGSEMETVVEWYANWLFNEHSTCRDALADAVRQNFNVKDDFINQLLSSAYDALLKSDDPAVQYFAYTLNVLPPQPRDPGKDTKVEWLGQTKEPRSGLVYSPAGAHLGEIDRGTDGLWYVTPWREGVLRVSAKASTQTDARCYLARLLTKQVSVAIDAGEPRQLRLVAEGDLPFLRNTSRPMNEARGNASAAFDLGFWDENHGIQVGNKILVESGPTKWQAMDVLEGEVAEVDRQRVSVVGTQSVRPLRWSRTE